jgi:anti-sigma regulatory factor (Ser/Thr protein kinase)
LIAEARNAVDTNDVEVASQTVVLEAIIEDQNFGVEDRDRVMTDETTIRSDQDRHAGGVRRQDEALVTSKCHA